MRIVSDTSTFQQILNFTLSMKTIVLRNGTVDYREIGAQRKKRELNIGPSFPLAKFEGREFVLKNSTVIDTCVVLQDYFSYRDFFYL